MDQSRQEVVKSKGIGLESTHTQEPKDEEAQGKAINT